MSIAADRLRVWSQDLLARLDTASPPPGARLRLHAGIVALQAWIAADAFFAVQSRGQIRRQTPVELLWPNEWMAWFDWPAAVDAVALLHLTAAFVALVAHRHRWARIASAFMLLQWLGAVNAFGKIGHGSHHLLLAAIVLATIPTLPALGAPSDGRDETRFRRWLVAQGVILLTYTLSGGFKVVEGIRAAVAGSPSIFTGESLPGQVGRQLDGSGVDAIADQLVFQFPVTASLLFVAATLLELVALATLTRPRLARVTALGLVGLHAGIYLTMAINFKGSMITLIVLFTLSPWLPPTGSDRATAEPAPGDGDDSGRVEHDGRGRDLLDGPADLVRTARPVGVDGTDDA